MPQALRQFAAVVPQRLGEWTFQLPRATRRARGRAHPDDVDNHSHLQLDARMYICLCNGITDKTVRAAAAAGVQDLPELTRRTGCGNCCGSCCELAAQVLREAHDALRAGCPQLAAAA